MLWVFRSVINGLENSLLNTKSLVYTMLGQRLICCKALLSFLIRRQNNTGTTKGGNCIFSVDASYLCDLCPFYSCITLIIDLFLSLSPSLAVAADSPLYLPYKALLSTVRNMEFTEVEAQKLIEILSDKTGIIQDTWHKVWPTP